MTDLERIARTPVPRTGLADQLVSRFHRIGRALAFDAGIFVGMTLSAVYVGAFLGILGDIYVHRGAFSDVFYGVLVVGWGLFVYLLPRIRRSLTRTTRDVVREGELFDATADIAWGRPGRYRVEFERDGAVFNAIVPFAATRVLHRLRTPKAIAFDPAGRAHQIHAYQVISG